MTHDLTFFRERGYQILPGLIESETADSLKRLLEAEVDVSLDTVRGHLPFQARETFIGKVDEACRSGKFDTFPRDAQMIMTGHFPLQTRLSESLWSVPRISAVRQVLSDALGVKELFMHMPPTARFVLPNNSRAAVPAHRDVSYNTHMTNFVILWVPLTDIDDDCGGVAIYEGSQNDLAEPDGTENFWLRPVSVDGYERVHCKMRTGDALLMSQTMLHSSVPNISNRVRCSIDFRFFGEMSASSKHLLDLQRWQVVEPSTAQ